MSEETPATPEESKGLSQDAKRHEETKAHHPEAAEASATPETTEVAAAPVAKVEKAEKPKAKKGKEKKAEEAAPAAPISFNLDDPIEPPKIVKAKGSKNIIQGIAHVQATFNNTIVTLTDLRGAVIGWSSAGKMGFKGSRKSTAYAAQMVAQDACRQAMGHGLKELSLIHI